MKRSLVVAVCLWVSGMAAQGLWAEPRTGSDYLGVGVAELTEDRAKALKLKDDHGVVVMRVGPDTPAARAGLRESDVIVTFNGQPVSDVDRFVRSVRETPPNRRVRIQIVRGGATLTVPVTIAAHTPEVSRNRPEVPVPPTPPQVPWDEVSPVFGWNMNVNPGLGLSGRQSVIGIEVESLRGQLAEFFGVTEGVLVRSVVHGSPADTAGMKAGDVIVRVAGRSVRTPQELASHVNAQRTLQAPVTLAAVRNKKEINFSVKLGEDDSN